MKTALIPFLASVAFTATADAAQLPVFPPSGTSDTFFGTRVDDPYRALENEKDGAVASWMKAHAEHARKTLDSLPGRDALVKRMTELDSAAAARIGAVDRQPGATFFTRRGATENVFKLYVRAGNAAERLLVDPEEWQKRTGKPHAINYFRPSPDSKRVAVGISAGGNELASLYVIEVATGRQVEGPIDRARYSQPVWLPDGKSYFYSRIQQVAPDAPRGDLFKNRRTYHHVVGQDPASDTLLLGVDGNARVPMSATESAAIVHAPGSDFAVASISDGVQRELTLYAVPLSQATRADAPTGPATTP